MFYIGPLRGPGTSRRTAIHRFRGASRLHLITMQITKNSIVALDFSLRNAETFLSHVGSDCGIANVNIGTSGAEIGGAFGTNRFARDSSRSNLWLKPLRAAPTSRLIRLGSARVGGSVDVSRLVDCRMDGDTLRRRSITCTIGMVNELSVRIELPRRMSQE